MFDVEYEGVYSTRSEWAENNSVLTDFDTLVTYTDGDPEEMKQTVQAHKCF